MFPLPTELILEIVSHLPSSDIREFSLCSKYLRETVLPFVFDHIQLRDKLSVKAFNDSGILSHIRNFVRYVEDNISMRSLERTSKNLLTKCFSHVTIRCYDAFDGVAMFNAYICASSLRLFPNLTGLDIRVRNNKLHYSLFLEIVKTAATGENYANLSKLSLIDESVTFVTANVQMVYIVEIDPIQQDEKFKLRTHWGIPQDIKIPTPPNLKRVSIAVDTFAFEFETDPEKTLASPPRGVFPTLYIADKDIASNLEELEIRAERMTFFDGKYTGIPIKYPRLRRLRLIAKVIIGIMIAELADRFPNLEELDVERTDHVLVHEYAHLERLTKLRKLRTAVPTVLVPELDVLINRWMRYGLDELQQVQFIACRNAYPRMPSITYEIVEEEEGRVARVVDDNFWQQYVQKGTLPYSLQPKALAR
ncbi:hypothetical protein H072_7126 [Dactylellina haptotyla CBS 200.50]|uniref:F-box domain-containing protein n=1 Tax=Dactylellina haptotyla (strain CBS 200.50) TaxID=1284197 RepID=S8BUV9_DACHA|nr:hypothetical protein H072_7126 [Dactylellina haptotyla CBS 200.50]